MMDGKITLKRLFEPISIGGMSVKNRIAMAPMGTGFVTKEGFITEQTKTYYEARAKGGAGLVIVECACVDFPRGIHALNRLVIANDGTIPGLTELARVIKKHGARALIQLHHAGRQAKSRITGFQPLAPSPIAFPAGASSQGEIPKELTIEEIQEIIDLFVRAAGRAKKAGFDGIELHSAHGYLLAEFLSPFCNKRQDKYGGSVENRARILIQVLKAIRESLGDDYPLSCRINGSEYGVENGLSIEDAKKIAAMVNSLVDAIHVSAFGYMGNLMHVPDVPGANLPLAQAIKSVVNVPVIGVGRLTPLLGEQAIEEGKLDIVAMGRGLLADEEVPIKAFSGRLYDIKPCIACYSCQDAGLISNSPIVCTTNAAVGRESEFAIEPAREVKRIAIIGGGPAGMEAARVLTLRGHKTVLFEKESNLGGQLNLAIVSPHKRERIEPLIHYYSIQLKTLQVEVKLNIEVDLRIIDAFSPDVVILSTGSVPAIPQLAGIDLENVFTAFDILAGRAETGQKVVIVGGGSTGCEMAEFLFDRGKEVTVVEMTPELATDMGLRDRLRLLNRITKLPINFITNAKCREIREGGVTIASGDDNPRFIHSDAVVLAVGSKPHRSLFPLLKAKGYETYLAGDSWHVGKIAGAISDGLRLGCTLY